MPRHNEVTASAYIDRRHQISHLGLHNDLEVVTVLVLGVLSDGHQFVVVPQLGVTQLSSGRLVDAAIAVVPASSRNTIMI